MDEDDDKDKSMLLVLLSTTPDVACGCCGCTADFRSIFFTLAAAVKRLSTSINAGLWGNASHFSHTNGIPISAKCSRVLIA